VAGNNDILAELIMPVGSGMSYSGFAGRST